MTEEGDLGDKSFLNSGFLNGAKNLPCEINLCSKALYLHISSLYIFEDKTAKLKNFITSMKCSRNGKQARNGM